jgi:GxxExxY protein
MTENDLARITVNIIYKIHKSLGPGLFESVYEEILAYELQKAGIKITRQEDIPVIWDDLKMDIGFRSDIIIENKIILELKSIEKLAPVHFKQLITYLRLTGLKLGLLVNFNESLIKDGIHRIVNNL